jgi:acyl-CoA reductase-like NAD-dependent aldehyde dehydrogenase
LPAWSDLSEDDRYSTLQAASDALQAQSETLSTLLVAEGGLTQREARATLAAALPI